MATLPPQPDQNDPVVKLDGEVFVAGTTLFLRDERTNGAFDVPHLLRRFVGRRIRLQVHLLGEPTADGRTERAYRGGIR